jgi:hypothetical protein
VSTTLAGVGAFMAQVVMPNGKTIDEELRPVIAQNRIAPISPDELRKVHEIKRTFHGRFAK